LRRGRSPGRCSSRRAAERGGAPVAPVAPCARSAGRAPCARPVVDPAGGPPRALLFALAVAAISLRPQLVALGPLEARVRADLGVSRAAFGALTTVPLLLMGLCAPLAAPLAARLGTRRVVALALAAVGAAGLARAAAPGYAGVLAATVPVGVALGVANTLPALVVKERVARTRTTRGTAAYTTGIQVGAALASALAVPLATVCGGWRGALGLLAIVPALGVAAWLALVAERPLAPPSTTDAGVRGGTPASAPLAPLRRRLVGLYASLTATYFGTVAWLADALADRGWSHAAAGWALGLLGCASIASVIALGACAHRFGSPRAWVTAGAGAMGVALLGVAALPALGWAWALLFGVGNGLAFASAFALALDATPHARQAGGLVSAMLFGGFLLAAAVPPALGLLRDATGTHAVGLLVLVGCCATAIALAGRCAQLAPVVASANV